VTGERRYVSDLTRPGLLHGAVLRAPTPGGELLSLDLGPAATDPSVTVIREGAFVGALADTPAAARAAIANMNPTWVDPPPGPTDLISYLRTHEAQASGWERPTRESTGDVEGAFTRAGVRAAETYSTAYLAHVPLETTAALAEWEDSRLTLWVGTQVPFGTRATVSAELGIDETDVRVVVPPTGGGFGGKHGAAAATEAARLARATGRPVRVQWSRHEEFTAGYLRPMAVIDARGALDDEGRLSVIDLLDINAGSAGLTVPYAVANQRVVYRPAESPLVQGAYRALAATANTFARESLVDELAAAAGLDPLTFRLANLHDERLAEVVRAAGNRFEWPSRHDRSGNGSGCALGFEKGGRVATCAHVVVDGDGRVAVTKIVTAYECGRVVSHDTVLNQIEGATMMALGGALFEQASVVDGRLTSTTLGDYRVPRFSDLPVIEVVLIDRPDLPSAGAGETPMIAVAPAIANAIFAATGRRLRSMPLVPTGIVA
jgi:isoquinoline 1-oxidoreductase